MSGSLASNPPPAPPPPPAGLSIKKLSQNTGEVPKSGSVRGALLGDISKGRQLRKVATNDRSAPVISTPFKAQASGVVGAPQIPKIGHVTVKKVVPQTSYEDDSPPRRPGPTSTGLSQTGGLFGANDPHKLRRALLGGGKNPSSNFITPSESSVSELTAQTRSKATEAIIIPDTARITAQSTPLRAPPPLPVSTLPVAISVQSSHQPNFAVDTKAMNNGKLATHDRSAGNKIETSSVSIAEPSYPLARNKTNLHQEKACSINPPSTLTGSSRSNASLRESNTAAHIDRNSNDFRCTGAVTPSSDLGRASHIQDTRFQFQDSNQLPRPRGFSRLTKSFRAGRGSSVPLNLATLNA